MLRDGRRAPDLEGVRGLAIAIVFTVACVAVAAFGSAAWVTIHAITALAGK